MTRYFHALHFKEELLKHEGHEVVITRRLQTDAAILQCRRCREYVLEIEG